jgi:hypothetical protein
MTAHRRKKILEGDGYMGLGARFTSIMILLGFLSQAVMAQTTAGSSDDQAALKDLRTFLFDPKARSSFAQGKTDATQANKYLEAFPQWAQNELLEIVMMIATESMQDSAKHVSAYQAGGVKGAMDSFSPAVRERVNSFMQKLVKDPKFNNPENLRKMNQLLPAINGKGS